jgi:hypothetical protein
MKFGARSRGTSILLPGAEAVLAIGGADASGTPTATTEILDTSAATPSWQYTGSLTYPRIMANAVSLPDGNTLVVGGGTTFKYGGPAKAPEMYDADTQDWEVMAAQQASRVYHATALLLPDGRVLSAGQDDGPLASYGEVYSPPYLFKGPRPSISAAPSISGYGRNIVIQTPDAQDIAHVSLIRPSSTTHSVDTDQRNIPLSFTKGASSVTARSPANSKLAPAGYYMLFIVNSEGVPSVASWVRIVN